MLQGNDSGGNKGGYKKKTRSYKSTGLQGGYGGKDSGWEPGKNPTIRAKRKNGTLTGWVSGSSQSRSNAAKKRDKKKPNTSNHHINQGTAQSFVGNPYGTEGKGGTGPRHTGGGKASTAVRTAAKRRSTDDSWRRQRAKEGAYKGSYYGPDEFKGNLALVKRWREMGAPEGKKRQELADKWGVRKGAKRKRPTNAGPDMR